LNGSQALDATTLKFTRFAGSLRFEDLPATAVEAAKARILSTLGVSLAAYDLEPVRIARRIAQPAAAGPVASIWGSLAKTTPDMAAFVNSAMVRCLDMSDTYVMSAASHPADAFPSLVAVAEAEHLDGKVLLLAMAIAYEAQCRFVEVVPYIERGWDQTPVVALGAALGCSRLLALTPEQAAHAISLAVVPNIALNQTRTGTLSMWKGMAGPQGARAGVFAAYLARHGMTAPDGVFEGKFGFWAQLMAGDRFDVPIPTDFARHTFAVQQTMIKSFPTRFNCQVPVFAAQKLRAAIDHPREIASLKIESIRQAFARWLDSPEIWQPQTRETADHSLPCTVAMALLEGTITPKMMERGRYKDPDVLELMSRCTIELPDEFAALAPRTRCCRLTATLKSGETRVAEYRRSLEEDAADPGWELAVKKFRELASEALEMPRVEKVISIVARLQEQPRIDELIALLAVTKSNPREELS
jgi:2-methylcitrate dehydratase